MARRLVGAAAACVLVGAAGWPAGAEAQRPAEEAPPRPQEVLALDMASGDWETARTALGEALQIPRADRGPAIRRALISALEAHMLGTDRRAGPRAPSYEALADHVGVLLEEVRALCDPAAIPALARSPAFGIREAVALADLGPAAMPEALDVATSPDSDGDRVANGLLALRVMVELWGGPEALSPDVRARLVDAAALYLNGPGERYAELTSSTIWGVGSVLYWALGLAWVLDDPGLRARLEEIAADEAVTRAMGVTNGFPPGAPLNIQTHAASLLAGEPPIPRPEAVMSGGESYRPPSCR